MRQSDREAAGKLLVRVVPGALMLFHGAQKIASGVGGVAEEIGHAGLPGFLAYGTYVGEVVAPILMIVGWLSRPAGLVLAFNMTVAILTAHVHDIFLRAGHGGLRIELPLLYLASGVTVAVLGPGAWSVSRGATRLG